MVRRLLEPFSSPKPTSQVSSFRNNLVIIVTKGIATQTVNSRVQLRISILPKREITQIRKVTRRKWLSNSFLSRKTVTRIKTWRSWTRSRLGSAKPSIAWAHSRWTRELPIQEILCFLMIIRSMDLVSKARMIHISITIYLRAKLSSSETNKIFNNLIPLTTQSSAVGRGSQLKQSEKATDTCSQTENSSLNPMMSRYSKAIQTK